VEYESEDNPNVHYEKTIQKTPRQIPGYLFTQQDEIMGMRMIYEWYIPLLPIK
jgi:hypothetical protein